MSESELAGTRQLVGAGKLALLGELSPSLAHDINNPLLALLGLVEFLLADAEPGTRARERLELVQQSGLEIREVVRAFVEFAREPAELVRPIRLRDAVERAVALFRRVGAAKALELVERYDDGEAVVEAGANELVQLVLNLLVNARQAMPDGGSVVLELRRDGDAVVLEVADSGPGIPEEVLPHVFEPFFTTKADRGAAGLGLAASLAIAQGCGGELTAGPRRGGGTTLTLRLPLL